MIIFNYELVKSKSIVQMYKTLLFKSSLKMKISHKLSRTAQIVLKGCPRFSVMNLTLVHFFHNVQIFLKDLRNFYTVNHKYFCHK